MPRFTIEAPKEAHPVVFSLEEDAGTIKLIARDGKHSQYVCEITPDGELLPCWMDRASAEAMGLQLDDSQKIKVV